ncbi:MAG: hypothetical protein KJP00_04370 [Bacteroidia bacterium]|nr:hypothetical protein [Bacteroidia bacterium]
MLFDLYIYGVFINLVSLSLWPSTAFIVGSIGTVVLNGGMRLLLKGIGFMVVGYLSTGLLNGFELFQDASPLTTFVSIPIMILNTIILGYFSFHSNTSLAAVKRNLKVQKEQIEGLAGKLAKYLSPQVYGSIFSGEKEVKIETNRKKLTIFFSDIKDFTSITDSMEAEGLTSLLNTYFNEMSKIALKHGGTIDKFIGDAIMIFFGDPKSKGEKEDAKACVMMALDMRQRMHEMRKDWEDHGIAQPLQIRMGINTGYCTVGNFGSEERMDYTIIGNQVNLASRLESSAAANQILISRETYVHVKDTISCQKKEEIHVKGIPYPVQTYQVLDLHENLKSADNQLVENQEGFSFSADLNQITKERAAELLEGVLAKLKGV